LYIAGVSDEWIYNSFDCRVDQLLVGCLGAVLMRARAWPKLFDLLARSRALVIGLVVSFVVIGWFRPEIGDGLLWTVGHAIEPPMVLCILVYIMANATRPGVRWLESAPLRHIGKVSYGIYLFHQVIHAPVRAKLAFLPEVLQVLAVVLVCVGVASLSYAFYERPFLKLKDRLRPPPGKPLVREQA